MPVLDPDADLNLSLEVATVEEMRIAIMRGRLISRNGDIVVYVYDGKFYILTDTPLLGECDHAVSD